MTDEPRAKQADEIFCPSCGAMIKQEAEICVKCGVRVKAAPGYTSEQVSVGVTFERMRSRWGVEQSGLLVIGLLAGVAAVVVGMIALESYLSAKPGEVLQQTDAYTWMNAASGLAVLSAALLAFCRWQSRAVNGTQENTPDLQIGLALGGISGAFAAVGLIIGLDNRLVAAGGWFNGAQLWAFLAIGWFALARPVPVTIGTMSGQSVGLALAAGAIAVVSIGLIVGLGDHPSYNTFFDFSDEGTGLQVFGVKGTSIEEFGITGLLLALGWFLGLRRRTEA